MTRIPDSKIAEVAAAADIVQVISEYVDLKKAGKDYRGLCPFHGDKDPSFYVSPHKGIFHCFGCATGGSVFSFLMKIENVSFVEAVKGVARRYGVPFSFEGRGETRDEDRQRLAKALGIAQRFFVKSLASHQPAMQYLENRGIDSKWVERLGLGFAPDSWDSMLPRLRAEGVSEKDAVSSGLIKERPKGNGYYDYFRSRIMIPIRDLNGSLVALGGRILGEGEPKYLNSPESIIFRKKGLLYGLDAARDAIRTEGYVVLVEGYFDQLSLRIRGLENVVAPLGTALGGDQIRLIKRFTSEVITVFDADEAGVRAVKRSIPLFLAEGIEPRCLILKEYKDPDEAINKVGVESFRELLASAESIIDFFLAGLEEQYDVSKIQGRNLALQECLPILRGIADSTERDYLIERFSSRIRVREERVRRALSTARETLPRIKGPETSTRKTLFDFPADERFVVMGMLLREGFLERVLESGVLKDLQDPLLSRLAEMMVSSKGESGTFDPVAFSNSLQDQELAATVASWLHPKPQEDEIPSDEDGELLLEETLEKMRLIRLKERKTEIRDRLLKCQTDGLEYESLITEFNELSRRLHKLAQAK